MLEVTEATIASLTGLTRSTNRSSTEYSSLGAGGCAASRFERGTSALLDSEQLSGLISGHRH